MIKLTSPNNVTEVELESGKKGKVLGFNLDFSLDSAFEIDLRAFALTTQQTPFVCRGVTLNNTNNTNPLSMVYDNSLQYPHIAIAGQISSLQVPFIKNVPSIILNSVQVVPSTIVNVYLFDFPIAPASFGQVGSNVNVINTISANIAGPNPLPVSAPAPLPVTLPSGIGAQANAWNADVVAANGVSNALAVPSQPKISVFGNASAATTISAQFSQDNINWYTSGESVVLTAAGNFGFSFDCGAAYVRLLSSGAATITATIAGKN